MENTSHFSIPYKGLNDGNHRFQFEVDDQFFQHFDNDEINNGRFVIDLDFDKKQGVSVMEFELNGYAGMNCDRCMERIQLPIHGHFRMLMKFGNEDDSTDEVMYVDPDISILHLGQLIYEFILLSIPMVKVYNCENDDPRPCNLDILNKLDSETEQPNPTSSIWDSLRGINFESN